MTFWFWFFVGPAIVLALLSLRGERTRARYVELCLNQRPELPSWPRATVIVPVKGADEGLRENLESVAKDDGFAPASSKVDGTRLLVEAGSPADLDKVRRWAEQTGSLQVLSTVVLVYPLLANDHGAHTVLWSRNGATWKPLKTDDLPSIQQAGWDLTDLGYVAVAGRPASPTAGGSSGVGSTATIAIVAGLVALAAIAAYLLRRNAGRVDAKGSNAPFLG